MQKRKPADLEFVEKLCKFILREQGRGFAMGIWNDQFIPGEPEWFDGVRREVPKCGTVACIGGSMDAVMNCGLSRSEAAELLGLSEKETEALFYGWRAINTDDTRLFWKKVDREKYACARSTLGKAKIAVAVLRKAVRTHGKYFHARRKKNPCLSIKE